MAYPNLYWLQREVVLGIQGTELAAAAAILLGTAVTAYAVHWIAPRLARLLRWVPAARPLLVVQRAVHMPLLTAIWVYGVAAALFSLSYSQSPLLRWVVATVAHSLGLLTAVWLAVRLTRELVHLVDNWARSRRSLLDRYFLPLFVRALPAVVPGLTLFVVLPLLTIPPPLEVAIRNLASLLLIAAVAWVLVQAVNIAERLVVGQLRVDVADNLEARRVYTQVSVLRKIALFVIVVIALASMLMVFDKVRQLGTSILASAGIVGLIVGVAAQQVLGNVLAGVQIALSQPIRIDDAVVVEGEWGWIEELTLTYAVVRLWDQRRLVLPIKYFIENPFQNWTRHSADLIGVVYFYIDYNMPVEPLRQELQRIVEGSPLWDGKTCVLQVTDLTERTVQLRALVSARNGGDAWDLRCEVREKLIAFVRENYPDALPRVRAELEPPQQAR